MTYLKRVQKTLLSRPLVVGTLTGHGSLSSQLALAKKAHVDLVELRLDTFRELPKGVVRAVAFGRALITQIRKKHLPILLTLRSSKEAGSIISQRLRRSDAWRAAVLSPLLGRVDLVDLEIRSSGLVRHVSRVARRNGVNTIFSYHDFKSIPSAGTLASLQSGSARLKADVLKVAGKPSSQEELRRLMVWGAGVKKIKLALIGMGALGLPSRILGFSFGSVLTYGHLGKSAAPGQIPVKDLVKVVRSIYG